MATLSNNDIKIRYVVETSNLEAAAQAFDKLSVEERQALAELKKFNQESNNTNKSMGKYRDWETDRKSTRLNSSHRL